MTRFYSIILTLNAFLLFHKGPLWFELPCAIGIIIACVSRYIYIRRKWREEDEKWWAEIEAELE